MKKEIPALFQTLMVQAILDGRKTKTRRTKGLEFINDASDDFTFQYLGINEDGLHLMKNNYGATNAIKCPYGKPGDILFVRENWRLKMWDFEDSEVTIGYDTGQEIEFELPEDHQRAYDWMVRQFEKLVDKDIIRPKNDDSEMMEFTGNRHPLSPSIHLPKWASRIWLEVTDIRVERLHNISNKEAREEGVHGVEWHESDFGGMPNYKLPFQDLWKKINGTDSWDTNPWVWVVSFKVLSTTGKPEEKPQYKTLAKDYDFNSRTNLETSHY